MGMAGIVFYFQNSDTDVFSGRPVDLDAWRYAVKAGGISTMRCVNQTDTNLIVNDLGIDFEIIDDLVAWAEEHKGEKLVAIDTEWTCPEGAVSIGELNHAEIDWYIFGSANGLPAGLNCPRAYLPQNGKAALHSVHIGSAVMLRRWEELNKGN